MMTLYEAMVKFFDFAKLELRPGTSDRYLNDIRSFVVYMQNCRTGTIGENNIISYLKLLEGLNYKHNAIVRKSCVLKKFFDYMYKRHLCNLSPALMPTMRHIPTMPRVSSQEEYRKILSVIPIKSNYYQHCRNRAIIRLLWDTGARVGEILSLDIKDMDFKNMKAVIRTEKSRGMKPFREIYWTKETNFALEKWIERRYQWSQKTQFIDPEALFIGSTTNLIGKRLTNHGVAIFLRKYSFDAKIPCFNAHSARHHFGHSLAKDGANNSIISSLMGHSQLSSSYIYTELNNHEREEAYNKFKRKKVD